ncbi:MAG: hypothetical protein NC240_04635 [Clostridium sp.]|nr:hypothetical protein [Clostridium sp.]
MKIVSDFRTIIYCVAKRWRLVILCALFCGIVIGVISYRKQVELGNNDLQPVPKVEETDLTEKELYDVNEYLRLKDTLNYYNAYVENSLKMKLNPYEVHQEIVQYYIECPVNVDIHSILYAYKNYVNGGKLYADMGLGADDSEYFNEIISFADNSDLQLQQGMYFENKDNASIMFAIVIYGNSEEFCNEIGQKIINQIDKYYYHIKEKIGTHNIALFETNSNVLDLPEIMNDQQKYYDKINSINNTLQEYELSFTDVQQKYLDKLNGINIEEDNLYLKETDKKTYRVSSKNIILGCILGMILASLISVVMFLKDKRVNTIDELKNLSNGFLLETIKVVDGKKGFLKKLDNLIDDVYYNVSDCQDDKKQNLAISKIKATYISKNMEQIFVVSTNDNLFDNINVKKLLEQLRKSGVLVENMQNLMYDINMIDNMKRNSNVIIIEQIGDCVRKELLDLISIVNECDCNVVGVIACV